LQIKIDKLARIVSTVFVPPSFTIIIFTIFAFYLETDFTKILVTILVALIFGFISPIVLFLQYRKKGKIVDIDASIKEERTVPMSISLMFYIIGLIFLLSINKKWKISAHTMGASGPIAGVTFLFGPVALIFLVISVLVGWSRIQLKCHSFPQVIAGGILAFFSTYFQIYLIVSYFSAQKFLK
jgi:membrane-associated phospholipid phosphatase